MANTNLTKAKNAKNDEFYTQFIDIQKEVNAYLEYNPDVFRGKTILLPCDDPEWSNFTKFFALNFENFGLKKLISTSYARSEKRRRYQVEEYHQMSLFELESPLYDEEKSDSRGRIFTLTHDKDHSGRIDIDDLEWEYLEGDGDFQSDEVKALRHEADFIVTNPPFSQYIEFVRWLYEEDKQFLIIGNKSSITIKEIFPLIMNNKMWSGATSWSGGLWFQIPELPEGEEAGGSYQQIDGLWYKNVSSTWFTNIEHGRRHQPLSLMTLNDNIRYSSHKEIHGTGYLPYDNYAAIEVPFTDAIPSDYDGIMGVPVTFLEKYCPEQFEILGITLGNTVEYEMTKIYTNAVQHNKNGTTQGGSKVNTRAAVCVKEKPVGTVYYTADNADGYLLSIYPRILIKRR